MRRAKVGGWSVALCTALLVAGPSVAQSLPGTGASVRGDVDRSRTVGEATLSEPSPERESKASPTVNPVDRQTQLDLPELGQKPELDHGIGTPGVPGVPGVVSVAIGDLPAGKSVSIFFDATVVLPFPNGVTEVLQQGTVTGSNFPGFPTDDPDDPTSASDPTATTVVAAPSLAGATKTVSDVPFGNGDGQAQPGEVLTYTIALTNSGNGGDSLVNVTDTLPAELALDLGSVAIGLGGGSTGPSDASAGNTVDVTVASVPGAGGSVTVTFNATVAAAMPAGLEVLSNIAQIESAKTLEFDTTQADLPIDALPAFVLDKDDGGVNVDPGSSVVYTLTYTNTGNQDASNVTLQETVPIGGLFDAGASTAGWTCNAGDPEGTPCALDIGTVAAGAFSSADFAVEVVAPQFAPPSIDNTAMVLDDGAGSGGEPVTASDSDSTPVNDLLPPTLTNVDSITGSGDGTLEECESVFGRVKGFLVDFSEAMDVASVEDTANWQIVDGGPDLDLSTATCGPLGGDDVDVPVTAATYNALDQTVRLEFDLPGPLEDGPHRVMACSGPGGIADAVGNELDGDGDFAGGDDFVRTFRMDLDDILANGHFDCSLDDWVPVTGGGSTIEFDELMDMDSASISGSAAFTNGAGNTELALGQCVEVDGGAIYEFSGFAYREPGLAVIDVIRTCDFFELADCVGTSLPPQALISQLVPAQVWVGFTGGVDVPPNTDSALCQVTLRTALGVPYEAFLDDLSLDLIQSPIIFEDGFESGDTSAWSATVP